MSALTRSHRLSVVFGAVVIVATMASSASAGPIGAGTVAGGPPILTTTDNGTPVSPDYLITTQYVSVGLDGTLFKTLALPALAPIGGVTAFVPTVNSSSGYALDYSGFVGFQVVDPVTGAGTTTSRVSVEFLGQHAPDGLLYAMTPQGGIIGTSMADDGIGPNGGRIATVEMAGIGLLAAWSMYTGDDTRIQFQNIWGLASIDIGAAAPPPVDPPVEPPVDPPPGDDVARTPEPTTLGLAFAGLAGLAGSAIKRRRGRQV
jgi:hypothetical protein